MTITLRNGQFWKAGGKLSEFMSGYGLEPDLAIEILDNKKDWLPINDEVRH